MADELGSLLEYPLSSADQMNESRALMKTVQAYLLKGLQTNTSFGNQCAYNGHQHLPLQSADICNSNTPQCALYACGAPGSEPIYVVEVIAIDLDQSY